MTDYINSEIIMLQGPPACGKSTWAKEYVKNYPNTIIVSRDSIREGTGTYWNEERESLITIFEETMVRESLIKGFQIIIDATNLNEKTINKWKNISLELHKNMLTKTFILPYNEALKNDSNRALKGEKSIGHKVIKKFYKQYFPDLLNESKIQYYKCPYSYQNEYLPAAIIIDIDGTIAHMNGRNPYEFNKVLEDIVDSKLNTLLAMFNTNIQFIFVSGRMQSQNCYSDTKLWLQLNIKPSRPFLLFMRENNDYRSDDIVKKELYNNNIKDLFNVIGVFDDRNKVVKMWREIGLLTLQVNEGDF
jgi:predicted kinase